jgi:hypothetical protein
MNGVNETILDFSFYSLHDGIKRRALPTQNELLGNALVAGGYNLIAKQPFEGTIQRFIPEVPQLPSEELLKFFGESAFMWLYKWSMGMERNIGGILLKQLLAQGGSMIYKQL